MVVLDISVSQPVVLDPSRSDPQHPRSDCQGQSKLFCVTVFVALLPLVCVSLPNTPRVSVLISSTCNLSV